MARRVINKLVFYAHMVPFASFCNNDIWTEGGWEKRRWKGQEIAYHRHDGAYAIDMGSLLLLI